MYVVYRPNTFSASGMSRGTPNPLAALLKETFPEITNAIPLCPSYPGAKVKVDGVETKVRYIQADSSFLRMFDVKILQGTGDFLQHGNKEIAITQEKARQLFGNEDPIMKTVNNGYEDLTICAIVSDMPKRSNYAFDIIGPFGEYATKSDQMWYVSSGENTILELLPSIDVEVFEKKLHEFDYGQERNYIKDISIKPLTKLRYIDTDIVREVQFRHIVIFAMSGLLVILCSLFNFMTLFISRFRIRQKELALRVVCGASSASLLMSVVSVICVLICVFGFVSLVSLTCEERRKEIAIRKINGATVGNILFIFVKEYFLLLAIGAVIAFSTGYYIMQRWLEQYVKQTSIPAWIYLSIVFVMAFVIILCVGWQVYKTSVANPAEVVKSE